MATSTRHIIDGLNTEFPNLTVKNILDLTKISTHRFLRLTNGASENSYVQNHRSMKNATFNHRFAPS